MADPLSCMLMYSEHRKCGEWGGDVIGVSDKLPEGIRLLDSINMNPQKEKKMPRIKCSKEEILGGQ